VGIDDATEGKGSATFTIVADGQELFASRILTGGSPAQPFVVEVKDRMALDLIVDDGGDGQDHDHAVWGNPYLRAEPAVNR
jgi:beta-galactosidase